jgi:hypothetical protein
MKNKNKKIQQKRVKKGRQEDVLKSIKCGMCHSPLWKDKPLYRLNEVYVITRGRERSRVIIWICQSCYKELFKKER